MIYHNLVKMTYNRTVNVTLVHLFLILTLSKLQMAARHGCDLEEWTLICTEVTSPELTTRFQNSELSIIDSVNIFRANISYLPEGLFLSKSMMRVKQVILSFVHTLIIFFFCSLVSHHLDCLNFLMIPSQCLTLHFSSWTCLTTF